MKRVACIKFAGLAAGGTEKYLQSIAILLAQNNFEVDYYYTNVAQLGNVHPDNNKERQKIVESFGIKTIPVHLDTHSREHWHNTNLFDLFDEEEYDFVQTARGGYPEYPFTHIHKCPIVDSIHSFSGEDKNNIKRAILLCQWQANKWIASGGNAHKAIIIPSIVPVPDKKPSTLRQYHNIPEDAFVYGFHQGNRDDIFSPNSLIAYSKIQNDKNYFIILGGCNAHRDMAKKLNLKNVIFIDFAANVEDIHNFLAGIDVFAHARSDGEVCSAAIIEALYHGKPVISHPALNMGHAEQIEGCGKMVYSVDEYVSEMKILETNKDYYEEKRELSLQRYFDKFDYKRVEKQLLDMYINL